MCLSQWPGVQPCYRSSAYSPVELRRCFLDGSLWGFLGFGMQAVLSACWPEGRTTPSFSQCLFWYSLASLVSLAHPFMSEFVIVCGCLCVTNYEHKSSISSLKFSLQIVICLYALNCLGIKNGCSQSIWKPRVWLSFSCVSRHSQYFVVQIGCNDIAVNTE